MHRNPLSFFFLLPKTVSVLRGVSASVRQRAFETTTEHELPSGERPATRVSPATGLHGGDLVMPRKEQPSWFMALLDT